ncbi:MAG: hemin uptake protein HemP [Burkholderiales bacterium]
MINESSPCPEGALPVDPVAPGLACRPAGVPPRLRSEDLLRGGKELEIEHGGAVYRLRLTAMGRLILTK